MSTEQETKYTYTVKELLEMTHEKIPFLWGEIIPKVGITFLTGSSDCNKSTLLRQLCLSIGAKQKEFLGLPLNAERGQSIYFSTEDEHNAISALIKKQVKDKEYIQEWQKNTLFVFGLKSDYLKKLNAYLLKTPCDLVLFDSWTDLYGEDLNQSNKVRRHLTNFSDLARKHQCAFIMVHHTRKGTEDREVHKGDMLGSQGLEAKARTVIALKKESPNKRSLRVLKGNYTPESVKATIKILEIDENMWLTHVGDEFSNGFNFQHISEKDFKKEEIRSELFKLRDEGISYEKIVEALSPKYGKDMVSKTTLQNWMKEKPVSQTEPIENKVADQ